jgi:hypothetical protein
MFEESKLGVSSRQSICLSTFESFSFEGGECGVVEGVGISDCSLFCLYALLSEEVGVRIQDTGMSHIEPFRGPRDHILLDGFIQEHGPGVFMEVVSGDVDPGGESGIVSLQEDVSCLQSDDIDNRGFDGGKSGLEPVVGFLVE